MASHHRTPCTSGCGSYKMSDGKKADRSKYLYARTIKGNAYLYFRMHDGALVPLPLDQSSPDFRRAYDDCFRSRQKLVDSSPKLRAPKNIDTTNVSFIGDTVGRGIDMYKESADYRSKKATSKKKYDRWLRILNEKLGISRL